MILYFKTNTYILQSLYSVLNLVNEKNKSIEMKLINKVFDFSILSYNSIIYSLN